MQDRNISISKISPLMLDRPVKRNRLFDRLSSHRDGNAYWISGPGGSGKSTLVASYLAEYDIPAIWYQIDALDRDPATTLSYLGQAARLLAQDERFDLPILTAECLPSLDVFLLHFFERLYQLVPNGSWIVFDNVQDGPDQKLMLQLLVSALRRLPPGCRAAILSREEPPAAMSRFLANRMVRPLGWSQLAFTPEELEELLERESVPAKVQQAELLHRRTKGWIAGALLWLLQESGPAEEREAIPQETPENVFAYFAGEILEKTDGEVRNFLLESSQLPYLTSEMAAELTRVNRPQLLERLRRQNFFVEKRWLGQTAIYQYHPLFHDFLKKTAEQLFAAERLADLRLRAARVLAQNGLAHEAVQLYASIGAFDDVCALVEEQAAQLVAEGKYRTLGGWLDLLPDECISQRPLLLYWRGIACLTVDPLAGRALCVRAYMAFRAGDDPVGQLASWSAVIESFFIIRSGFADLDFWIHEGERLGHHFGKTGDEDGDARFASAMLLALLLRDHGHPELPLWQERCASLLQHGNSARAKAALVANLFMSYHWLGETRQAGLLEARLKQVFGQAGLPAAERILVAALHAFAAVIRGNHRECQEMVDTTLAIANRSGIHVYAFMTNAFGVYAGLSAGDLSLAGLYLGRMGSLLVPGAHWDQGQYHFLTAWYCLEKQDHAGAQEALVRAGDFLACCGNPFSLACVKLLQSLLLLDQDEPAAARRSLDEILGNERLLHSKTIRFTLSLTLADCAFAEGDDEEAARAIHSGLDLVRDHGLTMPFPLLNRRLGRVVARGIDAGLASDVVWDMIRRWKLRPPPPETTSDRWPWPVKLYTLGGVRMVEGGVAVLSSGKPPRKLFELLLLLVAAKGTGIAKEAAAYRLWEDSDGDRAMQNLHTTVHRLRRLFADGEILLVEGGRLLLNPRKCWVDSWRFEWLGQRMRTADDLAAAGCLSEALRLWCGPFAPEHSGFNVAVGYAQRLERDKLLMLSRARELLRGPVELSLPRVQELKQALAQH